MRKSGSGEAKLYINSLCVSGSSIKLSFPTNKCYINKTVTTFDADSSEREGNNKINSEVSKNSERVSRRPLQLNVTDCKNLRACSKQLKQIYETVEVGDFKRILNNLRVSDDAGYSTNNKADKILKKINADDIYEEFFGGYYDHLYRLIETS